MKAKPVRPKKTVAAAVQHPPVYYRLHTLLDTVRAIAEHEDQLCTLLHEVKSHGATEGLITELQELLETLPSTAYVQELEATQQALGQPALVTTARRSRAGSGRKVA